MELEQWKQKIRYDSGKVADKVFTEGEDVWVNNPVDRGSLPGKIVEQTGPYSYIVEIDGERKRKHADQMRKRETSTIGGASTLALESPRPKRSVSEPLAEVPQNIQLPNPSELKESSQISENLTPFNHNLKDSATDPGTCDTPVNEAPQPLTPRRNPSRNRRPPARFPN
ncbi:hypothetical protein QE152_g31873 [Popillia japonica]|uniref:Uncharacterized protein n=1 Tax=Popillia japonica TaxID=7064 RepID=A0AAW1J0S4_POPJA